jgi:CheY-specific phosphatase CheX
MSEPSIQTALRESVVEVLEKMFFISAFEEPPQEPATSRPCLTAQLAFDGDPPGSLALRTSCAAARSIAADFLGEEPDTLSARQVEEVICELANMICGAVLSRVESRAIFKLGSPRILQADAAALSSAGAPLDAESTSAAVPAGTPARLPKIGSASLMVTVHTEGPECTVVEKYAF